MHAAFAHFQAFFQRDGLVAVFAVLLLENFGLPLPGEVALLYAGFQVRVYGVLGLPELILVASLAAIAGQTAGYGLGRFAGAWARRWLPLTGSRQATLEAYFRRHGALTMIGARFVAGLRILAGPVAGLYGMPWRPFLACNAIGAVAWVAAVSGAGWLLGAHWRRLLHRAGQLDLILAVIAAAAIALAWRRLQRMEANPRAH